MAPSMAPTVPPAHPDPALPAFRCRTARALGFQVERGVRSVFLRKTDLTPDAVRLLLLLFFFQSGVDAHGKCPWPGGWVAQGCPRHGPEACLGRVGQDAQPRSCRVRRTVHTCKRRPAYRDVLAASPAQPILPACPQQPSTSTDHPEGLRRWLDNQIPRKQKRPSTGPGRSRTSDQAGIRTPASPRRPVRWPSGDHPPCGGPAGQSGPGQPVQRRAAPGR
jgi:hypothetical protein